MGADISQFKQAGLVKHIPDLAKIEEHGNGEGKGKFSNQSFPHFSDYSMFPDRFNGKSSPKAILGMSFVTTVSMHIVIESSRKVFTLSKLATASL